MAVPRMTFASFTGPCWRAVAAGREHLVLEGSDKPGRYNRPGERTLYMSGSRAGVAAAMVRYGSADRSVIRLDVTADRLVDLRDKEACEAMRIGPAEVGEDWVAALDKGEEPSSWRASDRARGLGAIGLIDGSRRAPGEWHLVLFRWNYGGRTLVEIASPARE